jgi:phenylalanyl-tRNA synthetase alpha subunit
MFGKSKSVCVHLTLPTEPSAEIDIYWGLKKPKLINIVYKGNRLVRNCGCGTVDPMAKKP